MVMGDPLDERTDIGAIISTQQFDKVASYIKLGEASSGAEAHRCSAMPSDPKLSKGLFVRPVIFTGLSNDSRICREEIFGPVTALVKFSNYEDAIAQANDTEYGLAATIWTRHLKTALDATQRLNANANGVSQRSVPRTRC